MSIRESYLGLAQLLSYPQARDPLLEACSRIALHFGEAGVDSPVAPFETFLKSSTLSDLQEEYVASFDFNPKGSLYLGHQLHGDNQKKAAFMIGIRQEFGRHGFAPVGNELPDHLALLLGFLAHLALRGEDAYRRRFIAEMVLPGLGRMGAAGREPGHPAWQALIAAAEMLCRADCTGREDSTC